MIVLDQTAEPLSSDRLRMLAERCRLVASLSADRRAKAELNKLANRYEARARREGSLAHSVE